MKKNKSSGYVVMWLSGYVIKLLVLLITIHLITNHCLYATWIGGYYEIECTADKNSDFDWNLRLPKHYLQVKFWSSPITGAEVYGQLAAKTDEPWNNMTDFYLDRVWGKYWFKKGEFLYSAKEERHYIDSPLLYLVNLDKASDKRGWWDNSRGQLVRLNLWELGPVGGSFIVTKDEPVYKQNWYGNYFDQNSLAYISKLSFRIFKTQNSRGNFSIGYIAKEKDITKFNPVYDASGNVTGYAEQSLFDFKNEIFCADTKFFFPYFTFVTEYAQNQKPQDFAYACEMRDILMGPFRLLGRGYHYSENFRDELSNRFSGRNSDYTLNTNPEFDRKGYYAEIVYLFPYKMVNLTYKGNFYETRFEKVKDNQAVRGEYDVSFTTHPYNVNWHYAEVYTEFIKGLKGKIAFEQYNDRNGIWPSYMVELQGESQMAYGRLQMRLKDINSESGLGERFILGAETRVNLTEKMQAYYRTVTVQSNYKKKNWASSFYQIRYNILPDIETYLEYGEGWPTDLLAYDNDIADNEYIDLVHTIKFILKINF